MATGGPLSMRLGQIRRRLRLLAILEGGVAGAATAGLAVAVGVAIVRARGGAPGATGVAAVLALGALAGAAIRGARRISLARCARLADAALDAAPDAAPDDAPNDRQDRLLSALALDGPDAPPFARALIADAVLRAERLVPSAVAPARRPAGLPALGIVALALAGAALFPTVSRAARVAAPAAVAAARAPLPNGTLDVEREAARQAAAEAARLQDVRLATMAADLDHLLRHLASGTLGDGAALELARALALQAANAAQAAKQDAAAAAAAARALAAESSTRAAGTALTGGDAEQARAALGASAATHPAETARALAAAALGMGSAGSSSAAGDAATRGKRRLARDAQAPPPEAPAGEAAARTEEDRHLEHLSRDLDAAATACRNGDASCATRAAARGSALAQLERQGAARAARERLQRAAEQLRARIGRGELRAGGDTTALRRFAQAARGEPARHTGAGPRAGSLSAAEGAAPSRTEGGTGAGIGHQVGGDALGRRATDSPRDDVQGAAVEVPVADGAGPSRAEVIGAAAGGGFASRSYARVFSDYAAAVEDALGATAVPDGKRYLVRRYFDLIRPRPAGHPAEDAR